MKKTKVMVNGLPGRMATAVAQVVLATDDLELILYGLTGPEEPIIKDCPIEGGVSVRLYPPKERAMLIKYQPDVVVDFTTPEAVSENVQFYVENEMAFVLGTTGGDLDFIRKIVTNSMINAVIAPNMAKEIVGFQKMLQDFADSCPGLFQSYELQITESHQATKKDTSGTAKGMISIFNKLGTTFTVEQICKLRSESDYLALGIPREYWSGHGWHTYTLRKKDGSVEFKFTHNINGRQAYVDGTLEAIRFLAAKIDCNYGQIFTMIDVLK